MIPQNEDKIQRLLEEGNIIRGPFSSDKEKSDAASYQLLFNELKKIKPVTAPADFSKRVTSSLRLKQIAAQDRRFYFMIFAIVLFCAFVIFGSLSLLAGGFLPELTHTLLEYKWLIVFSTCSVLLIQFFDQPLVNRKISEYLVETEMKNRSHPIV